MLSNETVDFLNRVTKVIQEQVVSSDAPPEFAEYNRQALSAFGEVLKLAQPKVKLWFLGKIENDVVIHHLRDFDTKAIYTFKSPEEAIAFINNGQDDKNEDNWVVCPLF